MIGKPIQVIHYFRRVNRSNFFYIRGILQIINDKNETLDLKDIEKEEAKQNVPTSIDDIEIKKLSESEDDEEDDDEELEDDLDNEFEDELDDYDDSFEDDFDESEVDF